MEILQLDKAKALELFKTGGNAKKALLKELFPDTVFESKITDKIKFYEDACEMLKISPEINNPLTLSNKDKKSVIAYNQLIEIVRALNEGWEPDWSNSNETKWFCYFYLQKTKDNPSGFRFFGAYCYCAGSYVPSRLCFKSRDLAVYAAEKFKKLYKDYFKA